MARPKEDTGWETQLSSDSPGCWSFEGDKDNGCEEMDFWSGG
jgi:hypothetical protein